MPFFNCVDLPPQNSHRSRGWNMTELHCDNKRCVYHRDEHCGARAAYFIKGICLSVRIRIEVPPPMIDRTLVHDNSSAVAGGGEAEW